MTAFGTTPRDVSAALLIATTNIAGQREILIIGLAGAVLTAVVLLAPVRRAGAEVGDGRRRKRSLSR